MKKMNAALGPLWSTLNLNTRLFLNAVEGVGAEVALTRPNGNTNHIAFIGCHLTEARHYLGTCAGLETESPFKELTDPRTIEEVKALPALEEIRVAWTRVSEMLAERLPQLGESDLEREMKQPFPIEGGKTLLGCITFLLGHEAFHIGQIALLRRYFGLEAMRYS